MPALKAKQYKIFYDQKQHPTAFISWAKVNNQVEERFLKGQVKLTPAEWSCGENYWIINLISPLGNSKDLLIELSKIEFKDQLVKMLQKSKNDQKYTGLDIRKIIEQY